MGVIVPHQIAARNRKCNRVPLLFPLLSWPVTMLKKFNKVKINCTTVRNVCGVFVRNHYIKVEPGSTMDEEKHTSCVTRMLDIGLMLKKVDRDSLNVIRKFIGPINFAWHWLQLEKASIYIFHLNPQPKIHIHTIENTIYLFMFKESTQAWSYFKEIYQQKITDSVVNKERFHSTCFSYAYRDALQNFLAELQIKAYKLKLHK